jgi:hypothetical protein
VADLNLKYIACIIGAFQDCDCKPPTAGRPLRSGRFQAKSIASASNAGNQLDMLLPVTAEPSERKRKQGERVAKTIETGVKSLQEAQQDAERLGETHSGRDALEHASKFLEMALTECEQLAQM